MGLCHQHDATASSLCPTPQHLYSLISTAMYYYYYYYYCYCYCYCYSTTTTTTTTTTTKLIFSGMIFDGTSTNIYRIYRDFCHQGVALDDFEVEILGGSAVQLLETGEMVATSVVHRFHHLSFMFHSSNYHSSRVIYQAFYL